MTQQADLWSGPFGDFYQERNSLTEEEVDRRATFLSGVFKLIYTINGSVPKSVLEIGAGQGPNLSAIRKIELENSVPIKRYATEINEKARLKLQENVKDVEILHAIPNTPIADLVMTYGVMIHTHPAHIRDLQTKMYNATNRWILCCEYFAPTTRPIVYRGEKDALWLDDYGGMLMRNFSLRLLGYGFSWKPITGLDNITFWVFEKTSKMQ